MGLIPQDVLDQVLSAFDIAEVVGRYVTLKPAGRSLKGLCPFHEEKTPSFTVNPERQSFKCFGCGKGGNVFGFLMEHEGLTFPEAVRDLAAERGIKVPDTRSSGAPEEGRVQRVLETLAFAQSFFSRALASGEGLAARNYLARRGYDEAAAGRFGLGYAPGGWDRLQRAAAAASIAPKALEDAGLALRRDDGTLYDRFRNRVTFPVRDLRGKVVTFGARALDPDDQPKYLNGPETVVFKKGNLLYAIDMARDGIRRAGEALLMEGYTDVLMSHRHGVDRAVGGMGTAFTPRQAALLARFTDRVVLVYDGDDAGRLAAEKAIDVLVEQGIEVRIALLPEGRDVDEILLEEGAEAFEALLARSEDLFQFKLRLLGARHDLATPAGRARAAEALAATVAKVKSPVERDQWFRLVAERLGGAETEAVLRRTAARSLPGWKPAAAGAREAGPREGDAAAPAATASDRVRRRTQDRSEACVLAAVLRLPSVRPAVLRSVGPEDFTSPVLRRLYNAVREQEEAGRAWSHRTLAAQFADDAEAAGALAGLPEDTDQTLEETVLSTIQYLERRRLARRRNEQLQEELTAETGPSPKETPKESADVPSEETPRS